MYADFGWMSIKLLGACMRKRLCAKYAVVGWESMERSGACLTVFACLTVGSRLTVGTYTLHAYPLAWAQGPPGAPGPKHQHKLCVLRVFILAS